MMSMSNWATEAVAKLNEGRKRVTGQKAKAMAGAVGDALRDFCVQDAEFAQAVVQGGSFADCMAAVAKGVEASISDVEAYRKAVEFYFPGAKVHMQLVIDLVGDAAPPEPVAAEPEPSTGIILNLADFL